MSQRVTNDLPEQLPLVSFPMSRQSVAQRQAFVAGLRMHGRQGQKRHRDVMEGIRHARPLRHHH